MTPPLGWIAPEFRTNAQHDAHAKALAGTMRNHGLPPVKLAPGQKVILTQAWKHPSCVKDIGFEFDGFRQLTGSCVGVSEGNLITTLACLQRLLSKGATKAFVVFWPFPYGRTRFNEGDRGQGEGAVDSVMGDTITNEGYFDIGQAGLPQFNHNDGLALGANDNESHSLELLWSDGASNTVTRWLPIANQHKGARAVCNSPEDVWNGIGNGYPNINGCSMFVGRGSIQGEGENAVCIGRYDNRGGHSTCILGIWMHPTLGRLFLYSNQWARDTYPADPAGAGRCCVWMPESELALGYTRYGQAGGESFVLSHADWFDVQPEVLDESLFMLG